MENVVKALRSSAIVKGVEGDLGATSIRLWGQAKLEKNKLTFLVARYAEVDEQVYSIPVHLRVESEHDGIGLIQFDGLSPGRDYYYQIGYYTITSDKLLSEYDLVWPSSASGRFKTDARSDTPWNFCFGSCRLCAKLGPVVLFGGGDAADKVYEAVLEKNPEFWLEIGDQVYYDYFGPFRRSKTVEQMRDAYRTVRSYPHQSFLIANKTTYSMCDDHDLHRNNTDYSKKIADQEAWNAGMKVFREYQHIKGPTSLDPLYYSFDRNNCTFFVADTRSERSKTNIISDEQMGAIESWINDVHHIGKTRFFVSPTPVVSQASDDSWTGYPLQQRRLIEILLSEDVYILTGDAHCARTGIYQVFDEDNDLDAEIVEILSSGISSAAHDQGKAYDRSTDSEPKDYDKDNDFPMIIDNSGRGGLTFKTNYSTESYPRNPTNLPKHLIKGATDHLFTDITITNDSIQIRVINSKKQILNTLVLEKK